MIKFNQMTNGTETVHILDMSEYMAVLDDMHHPNTEKAKKSYLKKVKTFFRWFIDYANSILPSKSYKIAPMIPILFPLKNITSKKNLLSHWRYRIYLLREYIMHIEKVIDYNNVDRYKYDILSIGSEINLCIISYEQLKDDTKTFITNTYSSDILSITDIYSAANELLYIEEAPDISNIYLRDLKPNVIFQIRQLIELYGKQIIGFKDIKNTTTGESIHKFTQISWEFIEEKNSKSTWLINFPIDQNIIIRINKWANKFVHSGHFTPTYIQAFILQIIGDILKPPTNSVQIYNGTWHKFLKHGNIRITRYNDLKAEFQQYIDNKMKGAGRATIEWDTEDNVAAYIISL